MRAVVTVTGSDRKGIIAKVSGFLFERDVNIEDISQTILGDQFASCYLTSYGYLSFYRFSISTRSAYKVSILRSTILLRSLGCTPHT